MLFKPRAKGVDTEIWAGDLVNVPHRVVITDDGKFFVTFDTWGRLGFEHSVVIYSAAGHVIADIELPTLLTQAEIVDRVRWSVSSRGWVEDARIGFTETGDTLVLTLKWGKVIRVRLADGKVIE